MSKIVDFVIGDINEKKKYLKNEKRAKTLPQEYAEAYKDIKNYLWNTGMLTVDPLYSLVDLFEEAAANNRPIIDVTGPDVAAFADEFIRGEPTYSDKQRKKLNQKLNIKENRAASITQPYGQSILLFPS